MAKNKARGELKKLRDRIGVIIDEINTTPVNQEGGDQSIKPIMLAETLEPLEFNICCHVLNSMIRMYDVIDIAIYHKVPKFYINALLFEFIQNTSLVAELFDDGGLVKSAKKLGKVIKKLHTFIDKYYPNISGIPSKVDGEWLIKGDNFTFDFDEILNL